MMSSTQPLSTFVRRLRKIGIEVKLLGNYPWVYLDMVNGRRVTEKFQANHGFTIAFTPIKPGQMLKFTDLKTIFQVIRKYK